MNNKPSVVILFFVLGFCLSCNLIQRIPPATQTSALLSPASTPLHPASTPLQPAITPLPSTSTPLQPASTPLLLTSTPLQPTSTPLRPTETVEIVAFSFQELIHFGEGGGGGCQPEARPTPLVDRDWGSGYPNRQNSDACLLGFPGGELVELSIFDPQGREIPWMEVRVPDQPVTFNNESFTLVGLPGFVSLALGSPDWHLEASFSGGAMEGLLFDTNDNWWEASEKVVTHSRFATGAAVNPLDPALRTPYQEGDTVYLQGVNFTSDSRLPLGLYQGNGDLQLIRSFTAKTDTQGHFETTLNIGPEFQDDYYSVIPSEMFDAQDLSSISWPAFATFQVRNRLPYESCPDSPLSNLVVGKRAIMVDGAVNDLRSGFGNFEDNPVIGKIQPGETVLVLGGPECDSGFTWWLVLNENSRLVGWTAEGDIGEPWLVPLR